MKCAPILLLLIILSSGNLNGQCTHQVLHTDGSQLVNGSMVTVGYTGIVDVNSVYCNNTFPYFVGYNYVTGSGDGKYFFDFSPPINSLTLNFSGTSNSAGGSEIIVLSINGLHYAMPAAGVSNTCDPMAVLTPAGDLMGCSGCSVSGWMGTTIPGPISSLTVYDSTVTGSPNGSLFSLFICDTLLSGIPQTNAGVYKLFPNPLIDMVTLESEKMLNNAVLTIYNSYGQLVRQVLNNNGNTIRLHRHDLPEGIYLLRLTEHNEIIYSDRLLITN